MTPLPANINNMRTIQKGFKHEETIPLPSYIKKGVLKYDSKWADDLVCRCYGDDVTKYEINESTLELYYLVSNKMRFKVAEITYESYFTDIKGTAWEEDWKDTWFDMMQGGNTGADSPEDYEMYNLTLYHYDHPACKSNLIQEGELKGLNSTEYLNDIMERIEREEYEEDDDDPYYK
tara:strand:- start:18 stop:548 length:531 start_codon:yes stop_codon:yes gene_type:complete